MAVRSLTDQLARFGTRSRDANLARALALPDGASSAGCRQRRTLTTSDRSAKRRTPTRPILYRRSFQVVRFEGLVKPASTVCAARCTATLGPGSEKLNWSVTGLYLYRLLSLGLLLLSLSAVVPLACSAGRVGEGGGGGGGSTGPGPQAGGRAWAGFVGTLLGASWECRWPTHPADDLNPVLAIDSNKLAHPVCPGATAPPGGTCGVVWFDKSD